MTRGKIAIGGGAVVATLGMLVLGGTMLLTPANELDTLTATVAKLRVAQKFDEAVPPATRAATLAGEKFGQDSDRYAEALTALGEVHVDGRRFAEAEPLLRRALAITTARHGADGPETARGETRLAMTLLRQKRVDDAEPLLAHAHAVLTRIEGPKGSDAAWTGTGLAEVFAVRGRVDEAAMLHQAHVAALQARWGADSPVVVHALQRVVDLYAEHGRFADAEIFARRRLAISEADHAKKGSRDSTGLALSLVRLANLQMMQRRATDAAPLAARAVALAEEAPPARLRDMILADALDSLADAYDATGREIEAAALTARAAGLRKQTAAR